MRFKDVNINLKIITNSVIIIIIIIFREDSIIIFNNVVYNRLLNIVIFILISSDRESLNLTKIYFASDNEVTLTDSLIKIVNVNIIINDVNNNNNISNNEGKGGEIDIKLDEGNSKSIVNMKLINCK